MPLEPIAIIGIGCRFPGAANPEAFWQLLQQGVDAITEVPPARWDIHQFYDPDPTKPNKTNTCWGGFLEHIDQFDPQFFGIAPREVITMDPQQRLLLEVAWEAFEDAGLIPAQLSGTKTGVFIGIGTHDYSIMLWQHPVNDPYATMGTGNCIAANRISYVFDLKGPSLAIDTACSSSLVATHLACQSLWCGESSMALAGGVNVLLLPTVTAGFSKGGFMSGEGRCKSFDASADGYVRSEGAGIVVLKPLAQAIADRDPIYAVIRGSAVNQDGFSNGMAAPNPHAQAAVLREAYQRAGISPGQVQYIEAHGTGTKLGDPIEIEALGAVLTAERQPGKICAIGSVKTNIGHCETASGVAGLIKVALSLKHQQIPPSLHFHTPNPQIDFEQLPFRVQTTLAPWSKDSGKRLAGINSFGFGGTNAHVVVEAAPASVEAPSSEPERPLQLLTLSAKSEKALQELAQRYAAFLSCYPESSLADVCWTANTRRSQFSHRLAVTTESVSQLQQQLQAFASGKEAFGLTQGLVAGNKLPKMVFLFTGQGSQYLGMGRQLYETHPIFRQALDRCDAILRAELDQPLLEILYPAPGVQSPALMDQTAYTQPALFALEYALVQLWKAWSIEPAAVMGHSVGEYVAACVAGVFSLEDGLKLIAARSRLMQALPLNGAMVSVSASEARLRAVMVPYQGQVEIAAINGPESIVLSGEKQAIAAIVNALELTGIKTTPLTVSHAFHSSLMEPMLAEFKQIAQQITYRAPQIPLVSNLTGTFITDDIATPDYWCRHIRQPVQFAASMMTLHQQGNQVFIEIGPRPTLLGMGRACLPEAQAVWLPSLRPGQSDWLALLQSLAELYVRGVPMNWAGGDRNAARRFVHLPTYPFQRQRYWWEPPTQTQPIELVRSLSHQPINHHPLLGQRLYLPGTTEIRFQAEVSQDSPAYLQDHCILTQPIFPAAGFIEMLLAAGYAIAPDHTLRLEGFIIERSLRLDTEPRTLQIRLIPEAHNRYKAEIFSFTSREDQTTTHFTRHVSGTVILSEQPEQPVQSNLAQLQAALAQNPVAIAPYYQQLREQGLNYGDHFQGIQQLWQGQGQALGYIQMPTPLGLECDSYRLHPVLLDACFQLLGAAIAIDPQSTYLPIGVDELQVSSHPGNSLWCHVQVHQALAGDSNPQFLKGNFQLFDNQGAAIAQIKGLSLQPITRESLARLFAETQPGPPQPSTLKLLEDWFYELIWQPQPRQEPDAQHSAGSWLIFADTQGLGEKLAQILGEWGDFCSLVFPGQAYSVTAEHDYVLNPVYPEGFHRLLQDLTAAQQSPFRGVIHLWSLDEPSATTLTSLQDAQIRGCGSVLHLVQALMQIPGEATPRLWLVTKGTQAVLPSSTPLQIQHAALWGLSRVIRLEYPDLNCTCCDLDPAPGADDLLALLDEIRNCNQEEQIAYRHGDRYVARLVRRSTAQTQPLLKLPTAEAFRLGTANAGVLDNLQLIPTSRRPPAKGEIEIQVQAAGVNFRDVLNALGMLNGYLEQMGCAVGTEIPFGGECAGTVVAVGKGVKDLKVGDAVIAAPAIGSLGQFVTAKAQFVTRKPPALTFTEAATLPTTFLTAYYGLHQLAAIKPGDKVLIHAAAGGVGQAAIQLARQAGAEVFATASPSKWEFLKVMGVKQVMNSRTLDFADEVMMLTQGQGVDIVLNSLNGDSIPKSLEVLAPNGRFIEIGKIGIWTQQQVKAKRADISYFAFDLLDIAQGKPDLIASLLKKLMKACQRGDLQPLPQTVFPIQDAVNAFRYMAQAKHIGKVVITLPQTNTEAALIHPDGNYLITGGFGALGLQVAQWLVAKGAKHLVLVGRSQPSLAVQKMLQQFQQAGVQVRCVQADVANPRDVERILEGDRSCQNQKTKKSKRKNSQTSTLPLRGIIHAAGVLDDGTLQKLTWERCSQVMAAKVAGAWNLHALTQDIPLDFFVCFSSITSLVGTAGQGSYAAANAFMDALAHHRRQLGLPGLSINWGPWAESGMAVGLDERNQQRLSLSGITAISSSQGLRALEALLTQNSAQVGVMAVNWQAFLAHRGQKSLLFEQIMPASGAQSESQPQSEFLQELATVSLENRSSHLQKQIQALVAKVLGYNSPDLIDPQENFADLGMDSLMAVELTNRLKSSLGCAIPQTLMFDYPTVETLANYLAQEVLATVVVHAPTPDSLPQTTQPLTALQEAATKPYHPRINGSANGKTKPKQGAIADLSAFTTPSLLQPIHPSSNGSSSPASQPIPPSRTAIPEVPEAYYQFCRMPEYLSLQQDLERVEKLGNPFFTVHDGIARDTTQINGREFINYSTYNYLGMSGDPMVSQATQAAIARYGTSVSASRVVSGDRPIHRELEQEIAQFLGTEDCIVYIGGHTTNVTTIGHLFNERDLVLYDALSHDSIRQGCRLSAAQAIEFAHNDWQALEALLQQHRQHYQKVLIAIEGIYSTDGDLAPLPEIVELKKHYKALLLVDEAHSIGVLGQTGRGIGEHFNIQPTDVDLWMGTLSKSFASCGGYIAGCRAVVQYLKYTAPGFVYSVGMSPPNTASAFAALRLLQAEPERVSQLRDRATLFLELAQQRNLNTGASRHSPIIPIIVGEPYKAVLLSHALFERGIHVQPMVYPSVPYNAARLRFFMTCTHTEAQIQATIETLAEELARVQVAPNPL